MYVEHDPNPSGLRTGLSYQRREPVLFPEVAVTTTGNVSVPRNVFEISLRRTAAVAREGHASSIPHNMHPMLETGKARITERVGRFLVKPTHSFARPSVHCMMILFYVTNAVSTEPWETRVSRSTGKSADET